LGGAADGLYPRATIDTLPDYVLLETFEIYLDKDSPDDIDLDYNYDQWQTLVHVCRRWRCIVFASPRRLDLKLYCTRQRSIDSMMLDIWPTLPIVVVAKDIQSKEDVTNVIAALRHHGRVCKIFYSNEQFQDSLLKEFAAIDEPFPALTSLDLSSFISPQQQNVPVLPDSFLGGSAPLLQSLDLDGISYQSIKKLLSSTTNLSRLSLRRIPHSGYIAPETIVPCLSMLPRLESLDFGFQHPRSWAHQASRRPPPLTRVVLPNLISLGFNGDIEYLEDILSRIETPILNQGDLCFFNQLVFDSPLLGYFIHHTENFMTFHRAHVAFGSWTVWVTFSGGEETANDDSESLLLEISCKPLDWQLSALAQVLNSFLSSLQTVESLELEIRISHEGWQGEIEAIQWQEFFHPFRSVKKMTLVREDSVQLVAPALGELVGERATEVLPALQHLFLKTHIGTYDWVSSGPARKAVQRFIATRQLEGRPVTVHY
jgi:hypothetical protein